MRSLLRLALAAAVVAVARVHAAANIDSGFAQDGVTTYCQGVRGATSNPLEFLELEAHNAGRCPIDVKLDIKSTTVGMQAPMDVNWAASVHAGDVPNNIFPRAVDATTKKPQNVIASILRACKAGTNCALDSIVIPQVQGPADAETGPFDAQGRKQLRSFRFFFTSPGHYVVVGIVVLPGDPILNVSASEFISFQRVTVVEGDGPATVSPPVQVTANSSAGEVGAEGRTDNINFQSDLVKSPSTVLTPAPAQTETSLTASTRNPSGVDASFSGTNKSGDASSKKGGGNLNTMLIIGGVAVVLVAVLFYFIVVRRKSSREIKSKDRKAPLNPHSEAGIFRLTLTGENDMASSLSIATLPKHQAVSGSASVYSVGSSHRSLAPPRYTTSSSQGSADSGPFSRPTRQHSGQFPSYENAALAASGKKFQARPPRRQPSVASSTLSDLDDDNGGFSDLHDSSASLPSLKPDARSSYGSSYSRASSRLYSEARSASQFSYSDRDSEFGGSSRSTELGALSERGSRLDEYEV